LNRISYSEEIQCWASLQAPIGWTEAKFPKKEKKVSKKNLVISIWVGLTLGITSFCFVDDSMAQALARERTDGANKASTISSPDPAPSQFVSLKGVFSQKLTLPPPCTVVGISGQKVTLKDFYGKVETVEVEEVKNIKVGDKVVVKDGVMRVGIPPT
jgi:hypothetical protein